MCKVKTTEQFIKDAKEVHGSRFDYSFVNYKNNDTKVDIVCDVHGKFSQKPRVHLRGSICQKCGKRKSKERFIKDCKEIHGEKYDYTKTEYKKDNKKVSIICDKHGVFKQTPNSHLANHGCPDCGGSKKLTTIKFIERANNVHNNKYNYSKTNYTNGKNKVKIICPKHGQFSQEATSHLSGVGCIECGYERSLEFHKNKPTNWSYSEWVKSGNNSEFFDSFKIYVVKLYDRDESFYKIGKTYTTIKRRFKGLSCYDYDIIDKIEKEDGYRICLIEEKLHRSNKDNKYIPNKEFGGMYECFTKYQPDGTITELDLRK